MENKPTRDDRINLMLKLLMAVMFLAGFLIFIYPFVVDSVNNFVDQRRMEQMQAEMTKTNRQQAKQRLAQMKKENEKNKTQIPGAGSFDDPFNETQTKAKSPHKEYYIEHTIGAIFIPKINVSLPVFDQTNDVLLDKGATVLQGTSFPIGGTNTHSVITGHTGLPDKKLFTDLERLKKQDQFFLHIENKKLAYSVDRIKVIKPNDLRDLKVQKGRDIATLLTCTPYGINSHRLLVTGQRIPYPEAAAKKIKRTQNYHTYRLVALIAACSLFLVVFGYFVWRKVVFYQSRKKTFDLVFYVAQGGVPKVGASFMLTTHRGKHKVKLDGEPVTAVSDEAGKVQFTQIPGNIYHLVSQQEMPRIKAKVWQLKDKQFKVIARRKFLRKSKTNSIKRYLIELSGVKK